jgi:DNA-binding NtrC family response regulator
MLKNYIKIALKVLLRRKIFTCISLFAISFTLMVLLVITALFDHVFGPFPPETKADRTLALTMMRSEMGSEGTAGNSQGPLSYAFLKRYVDTLQHAEQVTICTSAISDLYQPVISYHRGEKIKSYLKRTDGDFWKILEFDFLEGGPYTDRDMDEGRPVAVINKATRRKFFGREAAVGQTIELEGRPFRVVGVVANVPIFRLLPFADIWVPISTLQESAYVPYTSIEGGFQALILARTTADIGLIKEEFASMLTRVEFPRPDKYNKLIGAPETFDLVLQDMNYSRKTTGEEGMELLGEIKKRKADLPVVLMTAWGSIELAVQGVKAGAADFVTKPWNNEQILQVVKTALGLAAATPKTEKGSTREELDEQYDFGHIIGEDPKLLKVLEVIGRVAPTDASVLITGESGTGKDDIAEAVFRNSARRDQKFVKVNLGGISSTLFESEMFGHVKGAFTDARQDRKGRFELADKGTIFLDEIGDLESSCQVKLLRVLQDRTYEVLGSSKTRAVDVRVIAATNRNLLEMVESGGFREDLLYRLNLIALHLPPLRERPKDIPPLARHFALSAGQVYRRHQLEIDAAALDWLQDLPWPGNIRQLKQLVERTALMGSGGVLGVDDFSAALEMQPEEGDSGLGNLPAPGSMTLDEMEKAMIAQAMTRYEGNISRVAEALGLSRAALYRRFEKYGIKS